MQTYVLKLGLNETRPFNLDADLFVYESGAATPSTGDTRIKVKPDTGAEMVLRPGQRFRLAPGDKATHWEVKAYDPAVTIDGAVIIGAGEFDDANTLNKFTLDATFANNVTVTNPANNRVLVALDPNVTLNTAGGAVQYTNSFADNGVASATAAVFTAAANVNGAWLEFIDISISGNTGAGAFASVSLVAKATAPATEIDGDVVFTAATGTGAGNSNGGVNVNTTARIKIAAGKGVYCVTKATGGNPLAALKSVLYTLL